jgi:CDP-glucose 4,6-dehydratase
MIDPKFWRDKKVFVTGHTGFKGAWLCLWLYLLGAKVTGYALKPPTTPNLFEICGIDQLVTSNIADIRNAQVLNHVIRKSEAEIVIHMAAQSLVRIAYENPVDTYATNLMGTVNLLEAIRNSESVQAVVNVTTDKCYEDKNWVWGYREHDSLGGYDPYANSKACSELITASYRASYFNTDAHHRHGVGIASARAGNVIGGGDWATDRLLPDCFRAISLGQKMNLRYPQAIRPWQHVLEPLSGYLVLAQKLCENGPQYAEAWNFGPDEADAKTVQWVVKRFYQLWGLETEAEIDCAGHPHEASFLKLDCSKAKSRLHWFPRLNIEETLLKTVEWMRAYLDKRVMRDVCLQQIEEYQSAE